MSTQFNSEESPNGARSNAENSNTRDEEYESARRHQMLKQHNEAIAALKSDRARWQTELAERQGWEQAITDGLKST
jgi:hypothetical protein